MSPGFRRVIPELPVKDVDAALAYYQDVLGYSIRGRHVSESGQVIFGSVLRDTVNFYLAKSPEAFNPSRCSVLVDGVDDLCPAFEAQGARILEQPEDKPWGYRQFTLEDLNGHIFYYFRFSNGVE